MVPGNRWSGEGDRDKRGRLRQRRGSRRRRLLRALNLESLERRNLLSANVEIGSNDVDTSYTRNVVGNTATYTPIQNDAQIGATVVSIDLNTGLDVVVETDNAALTQEGDILVSALIAKSSNGLATLTFQAERDVDVTADILAVDVATLNVVLNSDRDGNEDGAVFMAASASIDTLGGTVTIGGGVDPVALPAHGRATRPNGVEINGAIQTFAGNVSVRGSGSNGGAASSAGVLLTGGASSTIETTTGQVTIVGVAGQTTADNNDGVRLAGGAVLNSTTGGFTITGTSDNTTAGNDGVEVGGGSLLNAAGANGATPILLINGSSNGAGKSDSHGVRIFGNTTGVSTSVGAIEIDGTSGGSGDNNSGIHINQATVNTLAAGNIELDGQSTISTGVNSVGVRVDGQLSTENGGISISGSAAGTSIQNEAVAITGALNSTGNGAITIDGSAEGGDGFLLDPAASLSSAGGAIDVTGNSTAGFGAVFGGAVNGTTLNLTGNSTAPTPTTGISLTGGPIEASAGPIQLAGSVADGTAVSVTSVNTVSTSSTTVTADGGIFMDMATITSQLDISFEALDRTGGDDDVVVNNSTLNSLAGNVNLTAGDELIFDSASNVTGNNLTATVDSAVIDPDPGVGGIIDLQPTFTLAGTRTYNGGADIDTAIFDSGTTLDVNYATPSDGTVAINGITPNVAGVEQVTTNFAPTTVDLRYGGLNESIGVANFGTRTDVTSDSGQAVSMLRPTTSFSLDTGDGTDTVTLTQFSTNLTGGLQVIDGSATGDDTIIVDGALRNINGDVELRAPIINFDGDAFVAGNLEIGHPSTAGTTTVSGRTLTSGQLDLRNSVVLTADTIANGVGSKRFHSTVEGPAGLTVQTPADLQFRGAVGGNDPLAFANLDADGGIFVTSGFITVGDQQFADDVSPFTVGPTNFESGAGAVIFEARLDDLAPVSDMTINSALPVQFNADVGSLVAPNSLTINSGAPLTLANTFDAVNDLTVNVLDTATATDNLTLNGTLRSTSGNVNLTGGDLVTVSAAANAVGNV